MNMQSTKPDWAMNKREKARAEAIAAGETPKKRRWPWIVALIVVAALVAGFIYAQREGLLPTPPETAAGNTETATVAATQLAPYEITTIEPTLLTETLRVTGSLAPTHEVNISAEVSARLTEVTVRAGDPVQQGDLLASFDIDTLQIQLNQARANAEATRVQVDQALSDYERTQTLVDRQLNAPTTLEQAQSTLEQLRATLSAQEAGIASAQDALDKARVFAPFDGVISERSVSTGEYIGAGSPLFTLVDVTSLEVEASAPVRMSPLIQTGQTARMTVEGFADREFVGEVDRLAPVAISGSRSLPVYITIDNVDGTLRGGMFAKGSILLEQKDEAIGVPVAAIREDAEGPFVLTIEDNTLVRRSVTPARSWSNGTIIEITGGLAPGDVVLSAALPEVRAGQPVTLVAR